MVKYTYYEYETQDKTFRAIPVDGRVEIYEKNIDLWQNEHYRFLLHVSHEIFETMLKKNLKLIEGEK